MSIIDEKSRLFAANGIFPSVFLSALGFVLAQIWLMQMRGSWQLHILLGVPGLCLLGLGLYRARLHWLAGQVGKSGRPAFRTRDALMYALIFGTGTCIGYLVSAGSLLLLGIAGLLMYCVPWAKVPVCRDRFMMSSVVMLGGALIWLAFHSRPLHPLHYVVAAWAVTGPPAMMLVLVLASLGHGYRVVPDRLGKTPG